ncbi:uncharacterized protein LOC125673759 [Ostrea edulis]|uniref:uncharacterized protein LOC125673759 n=1 Tax=Ostrea edulis TaxID=37623 RepID=UPI0024AED1F5|nr:uncharacterized protein LOC125673759 [Ostrea edulis]
MAHTLHLAGNASELDKLIQSFEFENQQHVKLIESENQQIDALVKELVDKKDTFARLQEQISSFDEETKRAHKQFTVNRENVESLKKTSVVLKEHEKALQKKNDALIELGERESKERSQILEHYRNIWRDYEAKYKSFPLAKTLETLQAENRQLEDQLKQEEEECDKLRKKLVDLSETECSDLKDFNSFAVMIAGIKLETNSVIQNCVMVDLDLSKSLEEMQNLTMCPKSFQQKATFECTTQSNQQSDMSRSPRQQSTAQTQYNPKLISEIRQREEEGEAQMQVTNNSQSDQVTQLHLSGDRIIPSSTVTTEPQKQSNQEEPMVFSSSGLQVTEGILPQPGLFEDKGNHTKQIPKVNEQGDNNKVSSLQVVPPLLKSTIPAVSKLDERSVTHEMSPMMPKAYIPSLEEMRAKVAIPSKTLSPKLQVEISSKTPQLHIPSISKLSISQTTKAPLNSSVIPVINQQSRKTTKTSTTEYLQTSVGQHLEKSNSALGLNTCTRDISAQFERPQIIESYNESRNPKFTSTNDSGKVICGERAVIETNQSEEVEMEETEASRTANTPKMPEVQGEVSSACSTPESLQGSTGGGSGGFSPFDIDKHSERVKMFHKSPGIPPGIYTSKPRVTSESVINTNTVTTSSASQSFLMQNTEANPFSMNDFDMYNREKPNQYSDLQGFGEFNFSDRGFSFNSNTNDSSGSGGLSFADTTSKSEASSGFNFGNSFTFGGNSTKDDNCENFLSVFGSKKDDSQMESQETSFTFSFGGF